MAGPRAASLAERENVEPKPFIKWVGGKRQLLPELRKYVPAKFGTYHEPFVGGGALFFDLRPKKAVLSDFNDRLIATYRGVRDHVEQVIDLLSRYQTDKQSFLKIRRQPIDGESDSVVAAWMLYLNRTGFNGLYRVNSRNQFNVPYGDNINKRLYMPEVMRACSIALRGTELLHEGFDSIEKRVKKGDFVYFDPPYAPLSETSKFTSYTSGGFGPEAQEQLRDLMVRLKQRGVHVLQSNSSAESIRRLYEKDFEIIEVNANRLVNANTERRGKVKELLIR